MTNDGCGILEAENDFRGSTGLRRKQGNLMKMNNRDFGTSHEEFRSNPGATAMRCFIAISMLAFPCSESLAVFASERPSMWYFAVSGQRNGESRTPSAKTANHEGPSQEQDRAKNKEQQPPSDMANALKTLTLGSEILRLSSSVTPEGAIQAIKKSKEAFAIYKAMNLKVGMAASLFACGGAYYFLGQHREALSAFLEASDYSKGSSLDSMLRPLLEASIGAVYWSLGETGKALETLERALPLIRNQNNPSILAQTLKALGEIHVETGRKRKALEYLKEACALYRQLNNWQFEILESVLISALDSSLGMSTEAFETARLAIDRAKEKGDPAWEAQGHIAMGAAYAAIGNSAAAITEYNVALQAFVAQHNQDDASLEAMTLNNLGLLYAARGEFDPALDYFTRSLRMSRSNNDRKSVGYALNNIGTIYYRRGEPLKALRHFEDALDIAHRISDKRLKASVLTNMADAYFLINRREYAVRVLRENAEIFRQIEEPVHESEALISLADAYATMGRFQEALDVLNPLLESRRLAEDPSRQGYIHRELGVIVSLAGDSGKAAAHYAEALSKLEAAGDEVGQVELYAVMGTLAASGADYQTAEQMLTRGLARARTAGLRLNESLILTALASVNEKQGRPSEAETFYDQAIAVGESLRSSARIEELKSGVGDISAPLMSPAILLKIKLGKGPDAFALTEKARARTFLDQLNTAHIDFLKGANPGLVEQEQSLRFGMQALEKKLREERRNNPSSEAVISMAASLKQQGEAYASLLIRLKASNPDYAELGSYSPASVDEIQRLLGPRTTLVSYFVTAEKLLVFVVTSDGLQTVEVPVKEAELRAAIDWFRDFASLRDAKPGSLNQLEAWLIEPIRRYIKTADVIIVPHGVLHYVPFAALTNGREFFGDAHAISYLPSASVLQSLRRRGLSNRTGVLALAQSRADGLPVLRYADKEAAGVASLYHSEALLTGSATRAAFLKRAGTSSVVHIAAHTELNGDSPLFSRIALTPGKDDSGAIEVREIYGMDLAGTNLVVLSACQTQLGERSKGDDVVGLNRAFIYAGASSVLASLWTVDDEATSILMKAFYANLKQGLSKAAALQAAQAVTRKRYLHPYYWAAFVLTGDPNKDIGRRPRNSKALVGRSRRFR
jgi:CHAT domain-containing protein/Tfp pilus assembly protein PilF